MTKKDYELIANVFAQRQYFYTDVIDDSNARVENLITAEYMATALAEENPRFNQEMFFDACQAKQYDYTK